MKNQQELTHLGSARTAGQERLAGQTSLVPRASSCDAKRTRILNSLPQVSAYQGDPSPSIRMPNKHVKNQTKITATREDAGTTQSSLGCCRSRLVSGMCCRSCHSPRPLRAPRQGPVCAGTCLTCRDQAPD